MSKITHSQFKPSTDKPTTPMLPTDPNQGQKPDFPRWKWLSFLLVTGFFLYMALHCPNQIISLLLYHKILFIMVYITGMFDESVWPKIDTRYVMSRFSNLGLNVAIIFVCIKGYKRKETTWKHKGKTYYYINLPYEQVLAMDDARPLLLEAVAKRLGVPVPPAEEAAAA